GHRRHLGRLRGGQSPRRERGAAARQDDGREKEESEGHNATGTEHGGTSCSYPPRKVYSRAEASSAPYPDLPVFLRRLPPARPARSGHAVVDGGLDRGLFRLPQPGIVGDEAFAVDRQLHGEGIVGPAGAALVAVGPIPRPAIDLLERL